MKPFLKRLGLILVLILLPPCRALAGGPPALPFIALPSCRLVDTRGNGAPLTGGFLPPATVRSYTLTGVCGIPSNARAVSFNVTVTDASGAGFLTLWAQGDAFPSVSTLNFALGQTIANAAIVPLGTGGGVSVAVGGSGASVILDTNGYFAPQPVVASINGVSGDLAIVAGTGIVLGQAGQQLTISAAPASGSAVSHDGSLTGNGVAGSPLGVHFAGSGVTSLAARADHDHDLKYQKIYTRTLIVSPVGTPLQNGDALRNVLAGITTATATNPWLVRIEPGIYDIQYQTISMVPFVDMEGSGEDVTTITGGPYYNWGATLWAANAELRFLTVETYGSGSGDATALYNPGFSTRLLHVTLKASATVARTIGMWNTGGTFSSYANVSLRHVTILATGADGGGNYALLNDPYVNLDLEDVSLTAEGNPVTNVAISLYTDTVRLSHVTLKAVGAAGAPAFALFSQQFSSVTGRDVDATAQGQIATAFFNSYSTLDLTNARGIATGVGGTATGIYNFDSSLHARHSEISASSNTAGYGVFNDFSGIPGPILIEHSSVSGSTNSLRNTIGTTARIAGTQLAGPVSNAGTLTCAGVYDANYTFYSSTCP